MTVNPIAPDPIELRASEPPQATVRVPACATGESDQPLDDLADVAA